MFCIYPSLNHSHSQCLPGYHQGGVRIGWVLLASATSGFSGYIELAYYSSAKGAPVAQLVRVSDYYSEGPGFNPQLGPIFWDFFTLSESLSSRKSLQCISVDKVGLGPHTHFRCAHGLHLQWSFSVVDTLGVFCIEMCPHFMCKFILRKRNWGESLIQK